MRVHAYITKSARFVLSSFGEGLPSCDLISRVAFNALTSRTELEVGVES
jgi:hypothetical protein